MSKVELWACARTILVAAGATLLLAEAAGAQTGAEVTDPPELEAEESAESVPPAPAITGIAPRPRRESRVFDLNIDYVEGRIYDPAHDRWDSVKLRSYRGIRPVPNPRFVAPAIHAWPGETVRVKLHNNLRPADPECDKSFHSNRPHCRNGTNLHAHGLWVNPAGNGDNVLLSINPGASFEYEYLIPPDHPAGTFWYHTHRHGSTALQVSSGMAGALIIHGYRIPTAARPGDLDTLLAGTRDRVILLQQIQYYCLNPDGTIKRYERPNDTYRCDEGDKGVVEGAGSFAQWGASGRYTSINGQILPDFKVRQGKVERWRFIHGGVSDTIGIEFRKARTTAELEPGPGLAAGRMDRFVDQNCTGEPLPFHIVAADGITMAAAQRRTVATLQPGYRYDALVAFPEAASYCVIDAESLAAESVGGVPSETRLLGMVRVAAEPGSPAGEPDARLTDQLVAAAERNMPVAVRSQVVADLRAGLKLGRFTPHTDIANEEVAGQPLQDLTFSGVKVGGGTRGPVPQSFDSKQIDRPLTLGTAQEWHLKTVGSGGHPFHIHINPFQIVSIIDAAGNDVSLPGEGDGTVPQYRGLKNMWKDTLWVQGHRTEGQEYKITIRTRYQRYVGKFVLHCHILDHEDLGMMQMVEIELPDRPPTGVNASEEGHGNH